MTRRHVQPLALSSFTYITRTQRRPIEFKDAVKHFNWSKSRLLLLKLPYYLIKNFIFLIFNSFSPSFIHSSRDKQRDYRWSYYREGRGPGPPQNCQKHNKRSDQVILLGMCKYTILTPIHNNSSVRRLSIAISTARFITIFFNPDACVCVCLYTQHHIALSKPGINWTGSCVTCLPASFLPSFPFHLLLHFSCLYRLVFVARASW